MRIMGCLRSSSAVELSVSLNIAGHQGSGPRVTHKILDASETIQLAAVRDERLNHDAKVEINE